ncbi:ARABIDOPSIS THALIANA LIPID TRANSFER PROTEIN 1, lipid transfer protein 1, LIPID TRANSFER PROTEIN 1 [Hibiscus trionum]|uniref:Non-specific lipid-transfer protein n=1 Tax=Hibiscus trionum TaxID=183268 RepID=A0A9W7IKY7_HIBTR|nr:ARABIDOPSIS THALIANA LIPID TRANSFER PROTEIN 1, lipid transfer protein 1, LIPID TRANSFER PROTEIN 1 [Hibiscus trionum]
MASLKLVCGLVLFMLVVEPMATTAFSCGDVVSQTVGCIGYLQNRGGNRPPSGCCNGIRNVIRLARTTRDRQTVCRCLQTAARAFSGINYRLVGGLPAKCGVRIPFKISPSTNCNRYPVHLITVSIVRDRTRMKY